MCARGVSATPVDEIGVHAFEHERLACQVRAQAIARMIGGRTQEERHRVRIEHFIRIHRSRKRVVIGFRENFKIRARLRNFVHLSLPATGHCRKQA